MSKPMSAKVKETALEEVQRARQIAEEGARSGAYLYPLKARPLCSATTGMYYFATHKDLYKPLLSRLVPSLTLGAGITIFMFLYDPRD
ncbi:hypothetical protein LTR54_015993 [Friedmanniomyces endolithicus]|uniref:Uncharacterized protein n=1 Tax=Friedmanniomyces endolithicus TaxID=329885 RepID=A0AAN6F7S6_9PEZI|nr:hypothetical protein LTR82_016411 [Friedmanniomyces endolithicus]KAK0978180.1 hypothetical protein LTR54_015993 [Friedmanniomyces endolithicus]